MKTNNTVVQNNGLRFISFKFNSHRLPRGTYDKVLNFLNLIPLGECRFIFVLEILIQIVI